MGMMILKCSIQIWCPSWEIDHVQKTNYVRFCAAVRYAPCFLFLRADWCLFIYVFRLFSLWCFLLLALCVLHICYMCVHVLGPLVQCPWDWIVRSFSISVAFLTTGASTRCLVNIGGRCQQSIWSGEDGHPKTSVNGRRIHPHSARIIQV